MGDATLDIIKRLTLKLQSESIRSRERKSTSLRVENKEFI
jgi:hypothetical protein